MASTVTGAGDGLGGRRLPALFGTATIKIITPHHPQPSTQVAESAPLPGCPLFLAGQLRLGYCSHNAANGVYMNITVTFAWRVGVIETA